MKHLRVFILFVATFLFVPVFAGGDCGCSWSDGDGGHWTIYYDCDGSGQAILQHFLWNDVEYPSSTHVTGNPTGNSNNPC